LNVQRTRIYLIKERNSQKIQDLFARRSGLKSLLLRLFLFIICLFSIYLIHFGDLLPSKISRETFIRSIADLLRKAEIELPEDVVDALRKAEAREENQVAKSQLHAILKNIELAKNHAVPMCQDTGIMIFFAELGNEFQPGFDLEAAIREAVALATIEVPLRPNAVDPLSRKNSGDNTGAGIPDIHWKLVPGKQLKITAAPKGAGSENMSSLRMLNPTETGSIKNFVLETVVNAGGMPCPPLVLGVGIGGSFDAAARLAKEALLEPLDARMDSFEKEILEAINALGIGCMGLGGSTTALAVHVKTAHCHTASLPVAVNIQCWANRHASITFGEEE
jgi:fumarate hydratase subunit alpha